MIREVSEETAAAHDKAAASLVRRAQPFIDNRWTDEGSTYDIEHIDPTTGTTLGYVAAAADALVDRAVVSAHTAQPEWARIQVDVRRRMLLRFADAIRADAENLGTLLALEMGAPVGDGISSAMKAADYFEYYAGWVDKIHGSVVPSYPGRGFDYTLSEPYGVIGAIVGWNGPIASTARKVAPALAAGNCVVLKSPELAPFALNRMFSLYQSCDFPPGVMNLVTGDGATGAALTTHPGINKISFTGSPRTARLIAANAQRHLTPLLLELGGKSANIVFEDADLEAAASMAAITGTVVNAGQGCLLPTRLLVHDKVHDAVVERVLARLDEVTIGDPLAPGTAMGPVINQAACERITDVIAAAEDRGEGRLVHGGQRLGGGLKDGYFIPPTVFVDVDNSSDVAQREIFGPVLSVIRFGSDEEAVALANDTPYGLAAYLHTRDLSRAHNTAAALNAGYISVNGFNPMPPTAPFGGIGESGYGRESGQAGLEEFLRLKNVFIQL